MRVTVEGLSAHRGDRQILRDVSFTVAPGTVLGLIGANGSGKSTLLRALSGIDRATAGSVHYGEDSLAGLSRRQLAQRVAVMTQEHSEEFEIPVLDLVLLGRVPHSKGFGRDSEADIAIALEALQQVRAEHLVARSFSMLSGGERQRVLFARAIAQETPVLVLDEPTNHLDIAHQLEMLELVRTIDRTVLVALHDLNLAARNCDAIGVLAGGSLIAHGSPSEVLDTDIIRSVFSVDATSITHPHTGHRHFLFDEHVGADGAEAVDPKFTRRKAVPTT